MTIAFQQIPSNTRIPFVGVEFDNSQSAQGPALLAYRNLLIGQKTSEGTADANSVHLVTSADEVGELAGRDSMLYQQALIWFQGNNVQELRIGVLADSGGGAAAAGSILITAAATADGTLHCYFGDTYLDVGVSAGDTAAEIAAAIVARAAEEEDDLDFTTAVDGTTPAKVNVTFNHKGEVGNEFPLMINYQVGQKAPAGVAWTITAMTGGTGNPVLTSLIAALGDEWYNVVGHPYTDATSLTALEEEFASRASGTRMIDGLCVTSKAGSVATLVTLGNARNSQYSAIVAPPGTSQIMPSYKHAAAVAAAVARYAAQDPARPFQTLPLPGVLPPRVQFKDFEERNVLLLNGIGTTKTAAGGVVTLDRIVTTYQKNAAGGDDDSYSDANTVLTLMYLRYSWRQWIQQKYPRHKLANDGTRFGAGQPVMTPLIGKSEAIAWFSEMEQLGLVENLALFKANVRVVRNTDQNRLDVLLPPDLINQLIVVATNMQFRT